MMLAAFACAACVSAQAQDKKQEFVMPTGYAGITHEMSEFYEPVPPVVTPGTELKGGGFTAPSENGMYTTVSSRLIRKKEIFRQSRSLIASSCILNGVFRKTSRAKAS